MNLLNVPNNIETKSEKKLTSIFVIKLAAKNIATFLTVRRILFSWTGLRVIFTGFFFISVIL